MPRGGREVLQTMAGKRRDLSIAWPFAPQKVRLNTDTNLIKTVAMITMLVDHIGAALFPQYRILRIIGRIAFPIYAYCLAVGCVYTKDIVRYVERLLLLALISQPFYALALHHDNNLMFAYSFAERPLKAALQFYGASWQTPSIFLALTLGLIVLWSIRERRLIITAALLGFCWLIEGRMMTYSYGMRGIFLMILFYLFCDRPLLSFPLVAGYMAWWGMQSGGFSLFGLRFGLQMFALLALPFIYIPTHSRLRLNKWVFYFFYPAHLLLILLLDKFVL